MEGYCSLRLNWTIAQHRRSTTISLIIANHPDILVVDKQRKMAEVIDVAIPSNGKIRKKEHAQEILRTGRS